MAGIILNIADRAFLYKTGSVTTVDPPYITFGNGLYIVDEDPQSANAVTSYWTSKPLDFSDADQTAGGVFKTVDGVTLDYVDRYTSTPITVWVSIDGGVTFPYSNSRNIGTATGANKTAVFDFLPMTARDFVFKVESVSTSTAFTWTGIHVSYYIRGPYFEVT